MQAFLQLEHKEYMAKMNNLPNHHGVGPIQLRPALARSIHEWCLTKQ